ncbi:TonB-dependent siderophore receptor [Massilia sp. Se16.2.3]|uniref:TonB-dependent receptor plug domain-containing protein n=1 Tax=Massilia sp. Se16.2.3 TaxID=2709303 RepID=UPI001603825D|nr:TonB-dependent receptor [Massilia sp. Se16.2.3]QNB00895.1 TonB-dependent receptor [Massilia sp. Se16.2.3]
MRHDRHSTGTRSTSPRAALLYKLTPADTVKLIYGTSFRVPNAYELYYAYSLPVEAGSQITNPDLGHERIRTVETVLEHALGSAGHATFSVFQYDMRGLITQQADEETGALVFRNVAQARATGAEAALERLIGGGARVRASYARQRSHDGNGAAGQFAAPPGQAQRRRAARGQYPARRRSAVHVLAPDRACPHRRLLPGQPDPW